MLRILCALFIALPVFAKTPIDLMIEGRYVEARAILDSTSAEPRYRALLDAMTESDAVRACSLYTVISQRYARSDCDTLAQSRLQMAAAMGVPISPMEAMNSEPEPPAVEPVPLTVAEEVIKPLPVAKPVSPPVTTAIAVEQAAPAPIPIEKIEPLPVANVESKDEKLVPHDRPAPNPGVWFVQVGAFGNQDNARKLAAKLEQAGYGIALVPKTTNGKELLQVRVGGYPDRESCKAAADEIKAKYSLPASLVIQ